MRVLIKSISAHGASLADDDGRVLSGQDCREIVEAMRCLAPFTGCSDIEAYMQWTLRRIRESLGKTGGDWRLEGDTPGARAESFLAILGELGLAEFLPDRPAVRFEAAGDEKTGPVEVPEDVLRGIEVVRRGGRTNMLDYPAVIGLAREAGLAAAADWIERNVPLYSTGIFRGFVVDSEKKEG